MKKKIKKMTHQPGKLEKEAGENNFNESQRFCQLAPAFSFSFQLKINCLFVNVVWLKKKIFVFFKKKWKNIHQWYKKIMVLHIYLLIVEHIEPLLTLFVHHLLKKIRKKEKIQIQIDNRNN